MEITQLSIGAVCILWGGAAIYYAKSENVPLLIRPFVRGNLKNKTLNQILSLALGIGTVFCGIIFVIAGLMGINLLPFPR